MKRNELQIARCRILTKLLHDRDALRDLHASLTLGAIYVNIDCAQGADDRLVLRDVVFGLELV